MNSILWKAGFLMTLLCICSVFKVAGENMKINYEQAIKIANKFLLESGYDLKDKYLVLDPNNEIWERNYLNNQNFNSANRELLQRLDDKDYWVIQYTPKEHINRKGGGVCVIVDKNTGEILLNFYLK